MKEYVLTGEVNGAYDPPNLQEVLTKAEDDVKNAMPEFQAFFDAS